MQLELNDLNNESDVEQKLIYPLLTEPEPLGLAFTKQNIHTKPNIRRFKIEKRGNSKLYYPDYILSVFGLPLIIVEAKPPKDDLEEAYREARLYSIELNAEYPENINPTSKILCTNGVDLIAGSWDSKKPKHELKREELVSSNQKFADLLEYIGYKTTQSEAIDILEQLTQRPYYKPVRLLGGHSVRDEEIGPNTFGSSLALDYKYLFNPITQDDRNHIVRRAYIPSKRRERYVEPIDRIIRAAAPPSESDSKLVEDTGQPKELINILRKERKSIEQQVLLLIGGVGSGKSTFVDYLREVALPQDLTDTTSWVRINLNNAPISTEHIYNWLCESITNGLKNIYFKIDFDDREIVEKVYSVEIRRLKKSALNLLPPDSMEYKTRLVDEIIKMRNNSKLTAQAMVRYCCAERAKLLIIVLDNCDKRIRDEQLLMFQAAQWLQKEFRSLIILPLREETYDNHRNEPPLDTALKDLVFRIEPPSFQKVLTKRVALVLADMKAYTPDSNELEYILPNNMRVKYPATQQAYFLSTILKSIFEHDKFIRRMIVGLAGRDLRRAMEIFLEFCTSGHIGEDQIFRITQSKGEYTLPYHVVARVLLRMSRRFYNGEQSYIKNLFACTPEDSKPNYFIRLAILNWLDIRFHQKGPTRLKGYHPIRKLKEELNLLGLSNEIIQRELLYLLKAKCILAEHFRVDHISDSDLIRLAPAGSVHLDLTSNINYLSAISEETWISDKDTAQHIAELIENEDKHYTYETTLKNAYHFTKFLEEQINSPFPNPELYLTNTDWRQLVNISDSIDKINQKTKDFSNQQPWFNISQRYKTNQIVEGYIKNIDERYGLFVEIEKDIVGLVHVSKLSSIDDFETNEEISVKIINIREKTKRMELTIV